MSIDVTIRQTMAGVPPGEKRRSVCPFCEAHHEKSFQMRRSTDRPHIIFFDCWRGTCAQTGYVVDSAGASMVLQPSAGGDIEPSAPLSEHVHATEKFVKGVSDTYSIHPDYLFSQGVRYSPKGEALCMPWRNEHGDQIGWVEKRLDKAWHKSHHELANRNYGRVSFPRIDQSYHTMPARKVCVLVEGMLDAYRINDYAAYVGAQVHAVALLGADLSKSDAMRIATLFVHIMVCLDPDQWPKGALRTMGRFKALPCKAAATTLTQDPKDAPDHELEALFERCREQVNG